MKQYRVIKVELSNSIIPKKNGGDFLQLILQVRLGIVSCLFFTIAFKLEE